MTAIVSYRLYCEECSTDEVIRESDKESTEWSVNAFHTNSGVCPSCRSKPENGETEQDNSETIDFTDIEGVGRVVDSRLKEKGIETEEDVEKVADRYLLSIDGVGEQTAERIRSET